MKQIKALELRKEELELRKIHINDSFALYDVNKEIEEIKTKINDLLYCEVDNSI